MKQIWQHLKKKWIKYLFETLAIIIGIFGAFTLDNWNQDRLDRKEEIQILKEISGDLAASLGVLKNNIRSEMNGLKAMKIVIHQLTNDLPYHDSLNRYFYNLSAGVTPVFPSSGFETLKSKGIELVSNPEVRRNIITMFDQRLPGLTESIRYDQHVRHEQYLASAYIDKFTLLSRDLGDPVEDNRIKDLGTNSVAVPVDYNQLMRDQRYENLVREMYNNKLWMMNYEKEILENIKAFKVEVDEEINRLSS